MAVNILSISRTPEDSEMSRESHKKLTVGSGRNRDSIQMIDI